MLRYFEPDAALVFCSTREAVRRLHANLVERGFNVVALSGELSQNERTHALQALRDRRARVCVATDVAARGIDIPDLDLVIHADLPNNREVLQHRSGRTGRAGRKGVCVILVPHPRRRRAESCSTRPRSRRPGRPPPSAEDIRAQDQARLIEQVAPAAEAAEDDLALAYALMAQRAPEAIAAAYVRLARARMPSPEDLAESQPEPAPYVPARDRAPEAPRPGFEDAVWFRLDFGRNKNAEARWLLPMICRRGHVTKREIGAIRVYERETRFQIIAEAAEGFTDLATKGDSDGGRIVRLEANVPAPRDERPPRSRGKPFAKPKFDQPKFERPRIRQGQTRQAPLGSARGRRGRGASA